MFRGFFMSEIFFKKANALLISVFKVNLFNMFLQIKCLDSSIVCLGNTLKK